MKSELAYLAHHCCELDKYRVETCCIIGKLVLCLLHLYYYTTTLSVHFHGHFSRWTWISQFHWS